MSKTGHQIIERAVENLNEQEPFVRAVDEKDIRLDVIGRLDHLKLASKINLDQPLSEQQAQTIKKLVRDAIASDLAYRELV
jgi:hypothetical protein